MGYESLNYPDVRRKRIEYLLAKAEVWNLEIWEIETFVEPTLWGDGWMFYHNRGELGLE